MVKTKNRPSTIQAEVVRKDTESEDTVAPDRTESGNPLVQNDTDSGALEPAGTGGGSVPAGLQLAKVGQREVRAYDGHHFVRAASRSKYEDCRQQWTEAYTKPPQSSGATNARHRFIKHVGSGLPLHDAVARACYGYILSPWVDSKEWVEFWTDRNRMVRIALGWMRDPKVVEGLYRFKGSADALQRAYSPVMTGILAQIAQDENIDPGIRSRAAAEIVRIAAQTPPLTLSSDEVRHAQADIKASIQAHVTLASSPSAAQDTHAVVGMAVALESSSQSPGPASSPPKEEGAPYGGIVEGPPDDEGAPPGRVSDPQVPGGAPREVSSVREACRKSDHSPTKISGDSESAILSQSATSTGDLVWRDPDPKPDSPPPPPSHPDSQDSGEEPYVLSTKNHPHHPPLTPPSSPARLMPPVENVRSEGKPPPVRPSKAKPRVVAPVRPQTRKPTWAEREAAFERVMARIGEMPMGNADE